MKAAYFAFLSWIKISKLMNNPRVKGYWLINMLAKDLHRLGFSLGKIGQTASARRVSEFTSAMLLPGFRDDKIANSGIFHSLGSGHAITVTGQRLRGVFLYAYRGSKR